MDHSLPDHRQAPGSRMARHGATAFILLAMALLGHSLMHTGNGLSTSVASQTAHRLSTNSLAP